MKCDKKYQIVAFQHSLHYDITWHLEPVFAAVQFTSSWNLDLLVVWSCNSWSPNSTYLYWDFYLSTSKYKYIAGQSASLLESREVNFSAKYCVKQWNTVKNKVWREILHYSSWWNLELVVLLVWSWESRKVILHNLL